ncbi:NAD-binding protein [Clavulina sp. PMI_390]|nr:NAD-binding protein [Clavulina sp. PMI_390]
MTFVKAPAKILVTGASGFLATHCAAQLLADGYEVVGTVRSQSKGEYLVNLYENYKGKFTFVIVPDIEKEDAFDEAIKGVDGVLHTASPFHFRAEDPSELIGPAVAGTTGVLKSIAKHAPSVKRVIITSSAASIITPKQPPYTWSEADWNTSSPAQVEKLGKDAPPGDKYRASKTLAEKAAWEFVDANKGSINFDIATINPPFIYGPIIHEVDAVEKINESNAGLYGKIKNPPGKETLIGYMGGYVDVRDVALAHSRALSTEKAGGLRFVIAAGSFSWQDAYDALRAKGVANIPEGYPAEVDPSKYLTFNNTRSKEILGIEYRSLGESLADTVESIRKRFPGSL